MKKSFVSALCTALVAATALPAFALTVENTGFFRVRSIMANLTMKADDNSPDMFVDQRFRDKITLGVNDYIKIVYFAEIDFQWGDVRYGGGTRNQGGALGGDTVNLETKNLYVEAKIPNTPLTVTAGLQGYADNLDWVLVNADMAGFKFAATGSNWAGNFGWFKLYEESLGTADGIGGSNNEDDVTLWAAQFSMSPSKQLKVGADLYYVKNQGITAAQAPFSNFMTADDLDDDETLYYVGLNGSYKLPAVTLSGWFLYNWGKMEDLEGWELRVKNAPGLSTVNIPIVPWFIYTGEEQDVDVRGYAATLKADFAPAPGLTAMARVMYFSKDDDLTDDKMKMIRNPFMDAEMASFLRDGLMIFLPDAMSATYPALPGYAIEDAALTGNGLLGFVANATYVPPTMKQVYVKGAVGYFRAIEDSLKVGEDEFGSYYFERDGKTLGFEVAARVGYVFADKFDVSLNGSYAVLGNFYNDAARDTLPTINAATGEFTGGDDPKDPDNPFVLYAMVNVNF